MGAPDLGGDDRGALRLRRAPDDPRGRPADAPDRVPLDPALAPGRDARGAHRRARRDERSAVGLARREPRLAGAVRRADRRHRGAPDAGDDPEGEVAGAERAALGVAPAWGARGRVLPQLPARALRLHVGRARAARRRRARADGRGRADLALPEHARAAPDRGVDLGVAVSARVPRGRDRAGSAARDAPPHLRRRLRAAHARGRQPRARRPHRQPRAPREQSRGGSGCSRSRWSRRRSRGCSSASIRSTCGRGSAARRRC